MTLNDVIEYVDDIKPNAYSDNTKTAWINEVEGLVQSEVMLIDTDDIITYDFRVDSETELLVKPPHDKLYHSYLTAMVDFANGEYNRYQNTMEMFNAHFVEFTRWFASKYRPADHGPVTHGYYLTAYGIAVKHGYTGTEEDWLESLKGSAGTVEIGTVITGAAGTDAEISNTGTPQSAVLNFVIPRGDKGDPGEGGDPGPAATITVGSVTTGQPGTDAEVTNTGTSTAAVLNFVIPRGNTGQSGSGTGDMLASMYDPNGKAQDIFAYADNAVLTHSTSTAAHSDIRTALAGKETSGAATTLANRNNAANVANTSYTTLMFRGESLHSSTTTPAVNGAICWMYE